MQEKENTTDQAPTSILTERTCEIDLSKPQMMIAVIREPVDCEGSFLPRGSLYQPCCREYRKRFKEALPKIIARHEQLGLKTEVLIFRAIYGTG